MYTFSIFLRDGIRLPISIISRPKAISIFISMFMFLPTLFLNFYCRLPLLCERCIIEATKGCVNMKLNMDCAREVLLAAENYTVKTPGNVDALRSLLPQYEREVIQYACDMLWQIRYIECKVKHFTDKPIRVIEIQQISMVGIQFLNLIRNPVKWEIIKRRCEGLDDFSIMTICQIAQSVTTEFNASVLG